MKSLQQILKANGQSQNYAYQTGSFKFDKTAGWLVYKPSRVNNFRKKKSARKESITQQ